MKTIYLLEDNDVLEKDDLCRTTLSLYDLDSNYTPLGPYDTHLRNFKRVDEIMPYWVGKKIKKFRAHDRLKHQFIRLTDKNDIL